MHVALNGTFLGPVIKIRRVLLPAVSMLIMSSPILIHLSSFHATSLHSQGVKMERKSVSELIPLTVVQLGCLSSYDDNGEA